MPRELSQRALNGRTKWLREQIEKAYERAGEHARPGEGPYSPGALASVIGYVTGIAAGPDLKTCEQAFTRGTERRK